VLDFGNAAGVMTPAAFTRKHFIMNQIIFILLMGSMGYLIARRFALIAKTIHLAKPVHVTNSREHWRRVLLLAFGQKKMFEKPLVGIFHFLIYVGFVLINIEILEIILDGLLGTHRILAPVLGTAYVYLIDFFEILAAGVVIACLVFIFRRISKNPARLDPEKQRELKGFPAKDAMNILLIELVLMSALYVMNAADLEYSFVISKHFKSAFPQGNLHFIEQAAWWVHLIGILLFALYVTYSKHLHIFLPFRRSITPNLIQVHVCRICLM